VSRKLREERKTAACGAAALYQLPGWSHCPVLPHGQGGATSELVQLARCDTARGSQSAQGKVRREALLLLGAWAAACVPPCVPCG
jgi:hypothetical protein